MIEDLRGLISILVEADNALSQIKPNRHALSETSELWLHLHDLNKSLNNLIENIMRGDVIIENCNAD